MENDLTGLGDLFNRSIYRIPDYQRGYAWEEKEVQDFWEDLEILSKNRVHYGGVITLEKVPEDVSQTWSQDVWLFEKRNIQAYYVVDGQQRLTTAMILLSVILKNVKENFRDKKLDENMTVGEIEKSYVFESNNNNLNTTFLFSYEQDNDSYAYYIYNVLGKHGIIEKGDIKKSKYTDNLDFAYNYFDETCKKFTFEELDALYCKLVYKFVFNRYVINSKLDIFVTFETMNNRGKNLSQLELLKNRLIYLTTLYELDSGTRKDMRNKVNKCWKKLYYHLGVLSLEKISYNNGRNVYFDRELLNVDDVFLQVQTSSYPAKAFSLLDLKDETKKQRETEEKSEYNYILSISDLLKKVFTAKNSIDNILSLNNINDYISDLSSSRSVWSNMKAPELSDYSVDVQEYLHKMNYLLGLQNFHYYHYSNEREGFRYRRRVSIETVIESIIFKMLKSNFIEETLKVLKTLEKIIFLNSYLPREDNNQFNQRPKEEAISDFATSVLKFDEMYLYSEKNISEFNRKISKTKNELAKLLSSRSSDFKDKLAYYDFKKISYYILIEYEIYLMKKSMNNYSMADIQRLYLYKSDSSLEHIYPKNGRNEYWKERFGNLSDKEKNQYKNSLGNLIVISNKKNEGLGNKAYPIKVDGGTVNNPMGYKYGGYAEQYLVNHYPEWTTDTIQQRGKELLTFMQQNWDFQILKKDKNIFLGLPNK